MGLPIIEDDAEFFKARLKKATGTEPDTTVLEQDEDVQFFRQKDQSLLDRILNFQIQLGEGRATTIEERELRTAESIERGTLPAAAAGFVRTFGIDTKELEEIRSENKIAAVGGEIVGTLGVGGVSLKAAKGITTALKPFAKKIVPFLTKSNKASKLLKNAGILATESVIATGIFDAVTKREIDSKDVAIFGAIDLALPGATKLLKRIFRGKSPQQIEQVLKEIGQGKTRKSIFEGAELTVEQSERLTEAFGKVEKRIKEPVEELEKAIKKTQAETKSLREAVPQPTKPLTKKQRERAIGETKIEKFAPEAQPQLEDTIQQFGKEIREQRRKPPIPISVTVSVAKKQKPLIQKAIKGEIDPKRAFNEFEIEALGGAVNDLALKVKADPKLIKDDTFQTGFKNISKTFFAGASTAGRTLRQLREERSILNFEALEFIQKEAGFDELAEFIKTDKPFTPNMLNKFIEFARNMKLWSASAPIRSLVGNSTMQMFKYAETGISAALNKAITSLSKGRIQQDRFSREVIEDFIGMRSGLGEGFQSAIGILKENDKFLAESLFLQRELGKTAQRAIKDQKGRILRFGQNIQGAIDAVFRIPAGMGEARRRAVRVALQEGLEGQQLHNRIEEVTKQLLNDPKTLKEIQEAAATQTFQAELGEVGRAVNRLRQAQGGVLQLVVPFFNTAANLFKEFLRRTPLELLNINRFWRQDVKNAVLKKEIGGFTDSIAKMITGTTFFIAGNELITETLGGKIQGRGTENRTKRNQMFANGWQPYSIQVGDKYISYLGFEPISSFLGAMADWNDGKKEGGTRKAFESSYINIIDTFAENPFLQGIVDTADLVRGRKNVNQWFAGIAAGSVIPSVVRQSHAVFFPAIKRRPETLGEAFSNRFLLGKVEDRFNPLGQKAIRRGTIGNIFALRVTKRRDDPVLNELEKTNTNIGNPASYKKITLTGREINKLNEIGGKAIYEGILRLISNPSYVAIEDLDVRKQMIRNVKNRILREQKRIVFGLHGEKLEGAE